MSCWLSAPARRDVRAPPALRERRGARAEPLRQLPRLHVTPRRAVLEPEQARFRLHHVGDLRRGHLVRLHVRARQSIAYEETASAEIDAEVIAIVRGVPPEVLEHVHPIVGVEPLHLTTE